MRMRATLSDMIETASAIGAITTTIATPLPEHSRHAWSEKRWEFRAKAGLKITHSHPGGKGKPRKAVAVPSHRLVPVDRSKYPGWRLREIRAESVNFLGEVRR